MVIKELSLGVTTFKKKIYIYIYIYNTTPLLVCASLLRKTAMGLDREPTLYRRWLKKAAWCQHFKINVLFLFCFWFVKQKTCGFEDNGMTHHIFVGLIKLTKTENKAETHEWEVQILDSWEKTNCRKISWLDIKIP